MAPLAVDEEAAGELPAVVEADAGEAAAEDAEATGAESAGGEKVIEVPDGSAVMTALMDFFTGGRHLTSVQAWYRTAASSVVIPLAEGFSVASMRKTALAVYVSVSSWKFGSSLRTGFGR
jgi:hypothetical protein